MPTLTLREWLTETFDEDSWPFELSQCQEAFELDDEALDFVARIVRSAKMDDDVLERLVEAAGWDIAKVRLAPGVVRVRRGDFAEAIAAECVRDFDDLTVPVQKLRYQIDPRQTLPGSDVVGFRWNDDRIESLEFVEVKFRSSLDKWIAVDAHGQLRADAQTQFATTLTFLAARLAELETETYEAFLAYLYDRSDLTDTYQVCLVLDRDQWDDEVISNLDEENDRLEPLLLRVVNLNQLTWLVEQTFARNSWEVVVDDE